MEKAVWVVTAIEAIGVLGEVTGQVLGANAVMGAMNPSFGIADEFVNPR